MVQLCHNYEAKKVFFGKFLMTLKYSENMVFKMWKQKTVNTFKGLSLTHTQKKLQENTQNFKNGYLMLWNKL